MVVMALLVFYATRTYYTLKLYQDEYWITECAVVEDPHAWWAWHCRAMKRWDTQSYKEALILWVMAKMISPKEFKLLMNTHAKIQKDTTYEKSKKQPDMMKRLDYLYGEDRQITFNKFDIHLLSYEEMKSAMEAQGIDRSDIYSNTLLLADTVEDYDIKDGLNLLPVQYKSPDKELKSISLEGLTVRGLADNEEYLARLEE
jgi:hypothetical protein